MLAIATPEWFELGTIASNERSDAWEELITNAYTPVELASRLPASFEGTLRRRPLGAMSINECRCDPHAGARSMRLVRAESEPCIGLQIVLGGSETFRLGEQEVALAAGSAVLWSSRQPFEYFVHEALHKVTLVVPLREIATRASPEALETGRIVGPDNEAGALLIPIVTTLTRHFAGSERVEHLAIRRAVIELVVALLTDDPTRAEPRARSARHLARVQEYILDHLADAELRLAEIAHSTGVSLRYLHLLFERSDTSVSAWILNARLERCREALLDPGQAFRSITEIAFGWGFNNAAYFSRAFKRRYGVCPSDCRGTVGNELADGTRRR